LNIVNGVVQNYDIDAVHFDDYFYPYKVAGEKFNTLLPMRNMVMDEY
jgi:uncharacterized lipoprotein YddW (UPF0748 family)